MKYLDANKLNKYGFKNNIYVTKLKNNFILQIEYKDNELISKVYDEFNEEYLPFYVKDNIGSYVAEIKDNVNKVVDDIYSKCEIKNNLVEDIIKYVKDKYNTIPDHPFPNDDITMTLKNDKGKWYALIMEVKSSVLKKENDELIKIMNIKLNPEEIKELIDNINYYEAYHMNKKYWITILLDSNLEIYKVKELIDKSYELVK